MRTDFNDVIRAVKQLHSACFEKDAGSLEDIDYWCDMLKNLLNMKYEEVNFT